MEKELKKYLGHTVEIIYLGADGSITQRLVNVRFVVGGVLKAYCLERKAPRLFRIDNILALQPLPQGARTS